MLENHYNDDSTQFNRLLIAIKGRTVWKHISSEYNWDNIRRKDMIGENVHNTIFDESTVIKVCEMLSAKKNYQSIRDYFNNSSTQFYSLMRSVKQRKTWKHISYKYSF